MNDLNCVTIKFHNIENNTMGEITFGFVDEKYMIQGLFDRLDKKNFDDWSYREIKLKAQSILSVERHNRCVVNNDP